MKANFNTVAPHLTLQRALQKPAASPPAKAGESLGNTFEKMLQDVNQVQMEAEEKQAEFLTSKNKDIHGTMVAMEKADVSLKLLLQVRNKLTSAYEEVMRMQV